MKRVNIPAMLERLTEVWAEIGQSQGLQTKVTTDLRGTFTLWSGKHSPQANRNYEDSYECCMAYMQGCIDSQRPAKY